MFFLDENFSHLELRLFVEPVNYFGACLWASCGISHSCSPARGKLNSDLESVNCSAEELQIHQNQRISMLSCLVVIISDNILRTWISDSEIGN